jgi:hypothetical protein
LVDVSAVSEASLVPDSGSVGETIGDGTGSGLFGVILGVLVDSLGVSGCDAVDGGTAAGD